MKDWVGNSNSIFKQIGASNHCDDEREQHDYYATDPKAIDDLLKYETFSNNIWECASGGGHLVNKLREKGFNVFSTDLIDRGAQDEIIDFLKTNKHFKGDIITNPPYKYCEEFILKAIELTNDKVAMFLKLTTLEGQSRFKNIYSKYPPIYIYIYSKRIQCAKNGNFDGKRAVCYAWFIWKKGFKGEPTIRWLN